ncbi:hypothetical protein QOT17_014966 [Balamuthia mandrillaris]
MHPHRWPASGEQKHGEGEDPTGGSTEVVTASQSGSNRVAGSWSLFPMFHEQQPLPAAPLAPTQPSIQLLPTATPAGTMVKPPPATLHHHHQQDKEEEEEEDGYNDPDKPDSEELFQDMTFFFPRLKSGVSDLSQGKSKEKRKRQLEQQLYTLELSYRAISAKRKKWEQRCWQQQYPTHPSEVRLRQRQHHPFDFDPHHHYPHIQRRTYPQPQLAINEAASSLTNHEHLRNNKSIEQQAREEGDNRGATAPTTITISTIEENLALLHSITQFIRSYRQHLWVFLPVHPAVITEENVELLYKEASSQDSVLGLCFNIVIALGAKVLGNGKANVASQLFRRARCNLECLYDVFHYNVAEALNLMSYYSLLEADGERATYYASLAAEMCRCLGKLNTVTYVASIRRLSNFTSSQRKRNRCLQEVNRCSLGGGIYTSLFHQSAGSWALPVHPKAVLTSAIVMRSLFNIGLGLLMLPPNKESVRPFSTPYDDVRPRLMLDVDSSYEDDLDEGDTGTENEDDSEIEGDEDDEETTQPPVVETATITIEGLPTASATITAGNAVPLRTTDSSVLLSATAEDQVDELEEQASAMSGTEKECSPGADILDHGPLMARSGLQLIRDSNSPEWFPASARFALEHQPLLLPSGLDNSLSSFSYTSTCPFTPIANKEDAATNNSCIPPTYWSSFDFDNNFDDTAAINHLQFDAFHPQDNQHNSFVPQEAPSSSFSLSFQLPLSQSPPSYTKRPRGRKKRSAKARTKESWDQQVVEYAKDNPFFDATVSNTYKRFSQVLEGLEKEIDEQKPSLPPSYHHHLRITLLSMHMDLEIRSGTFESGLKRALAFYDELQTQPLLLYYSPGFETMLQLTFLSEVLSAGAFRKNADDVESLARSTFEDRYPVAGRLIGT